MNDDQLMRALIHQVRRATPPKGSECDVRTIITKPMWKRFLRATKTPYGEPTVWQGKGTRRVFGSETILVDAREQFAISYAPEKP